MDERHLVDVLTQVREDFGDRLAAFAARSELERRLHQIADRVLEEARRVFELGFEFADRLAVPLFQARFVIPRVDVAGPSVDKEPDHVLRLRRKMPVARSQRIERTISQRVRLRRAKQSFVLKEPCEAEHAETATGFGEHLTA